MSWDKFHESLEAIVNCRFCECSVDESTRCTFTELFPLVGQSDLHYSWNVTGWGLYPDSMGSDQLKR